MLNIEVFAKEALGVKMNANDLEAIKKLVNGQKIKPRDLLGMKKANMILKEYVAQCMRECVKKYQG